MSVISRCMRLSNAILLYVLFISPLSLLFMNLSQVLVAAKKAFNDETSFVLTTLYKGVSIQLPISLPWHLEPDNEGFTIEDEVRYLCHMHFVNDRDRVGCFAKMAPEVIELDKHFFKKRYTDLEDWISIVKTIGLTESEVEFMRTQITKPFVIFNEDLRESATLMNPDKPVRILEIGSSTGGSAMWFAHNLLPENPNSLLICVDAWYNANPIRNGGDPVDKTLHAFKRNVRSFQHHDKVKFIKADSLTGVALLYSHLDSPENRIDLGLENDEFVFDVVYIDGAHTMAEVLVDALMAIPLLRPGGFLIFDDYNCNPWLLPNERVKEAVDAIWESHKEQLDILRFKPRLQVASFRKKSKESLDSLKVENIMIQEKQLHSRFHYCFNSALAVVSDMSSSVNVLDISYYTSGFSDFIVSFSHESSWSSFLLMIVSDFSKDLYDDNIGLLSGGLGKEMQATYSSGIKKRIEKLNGQEPQEGALLLDYSGSSKEELIKMVAEGGVKFNIIYFDGRSSFSQALLELSLAFRLLEKGGVFILDTAFTKSFNRAYSVFTDAYFENLSVLGGQEMLNQAKTISTANPSSSNHKTSYTSSSFKGKSNDDLIILRKISDRFIIPPSDLKFWEKL